MQRMNSRLRVLERLTAALACTGTCPRCCHGHDARPGRLSAKEQAEELADLLERAGLVFVADDVLEVCGDAEDGPEAGADDSITQHTGRGPWSPYD